MLLATACESAPVSPLDAPAATASDATLPAIAPTTALFSKSSPAPAIVAGPAIGAGRVRTRNPYFLDRIVLLDDPFGTIVGNAIEFDAKREASGLASGSFEFTAVYRRAKVKLKGTIVCFTVIGNTARVGGIVTSSNFAGIPVGTSETWSLTDNGAPESNRLDTSSTLLGGDANYALAYCENGLPYSERPVIGGSIEILQ
jgi:hypothetical protein